MIVEGVQFKSSWRQNLLEAKPVSNFKNLLENGEHDKHDGDDDDDDDDDDDKS